MVGRCSSFVLVAAFVFVLVIVACGGTPSSQADRSIQSISISPASADAKNSGGQVQFIATGYYNTQPSPVTPLPATWGVCQQGTPASAVTVTNGLAQCGPSAVGTFTVFAYDFPNPSCLAITACGGGCTVEGTAQLTCP